MKVTFFYLCFIVSILSFAQNSEDPNEQVAMGKNYFIGNEVEKDFLKAFHCFQKATEQGSDEGQFMLGLFYLNGFGIEKDSSTAFYWFQKSAEQGNNSGQTMLGYCYQNGKGVEIDLEKAHYWYQKAAEQGDDIAQNELGYIYLNGEGVKKNFQKAFFCFQKAAEQGNADGQTRLGYCYQDGEGVEMDKEKAFYWFQKAAEQGYDKGQAALGICYDYAYGVEKDSNKALYWYQKAAEQGNANGQTRLGYCYQNGKGVEKDLGKALYWFQKAAEQRNIVSMYTLGLYYLSGIGVECNIEKGASLMQEAINNGLIISFNNQNNIYDTVIKALGGDAESQYKMGLYYEEVLSESLIVQDNDCFALEWLEKAAAQAYRNAQIEAGIIYFFRWKNKLFENTWYKRLAIDYLKKAGAEEDPDLMIYLSILTSYGREGSGKEGLMWCDKAISKGLPIKAKKVVGLRKYEYTLALAYFIKAIIYRSGRDDVAQDYEKFCDNIYMANKYCNDIQFYIAICYYYGIGVEKNQQKGIEIFNLTKKDSGIKYDVGDKYQLASIIDKYLEVCSNTITSVKLNDNIVNNIEYAEYELRKFLKK